MKFTLVWKDPDGERMGDLFMAAETFAIEKDIDAEAARVHLANLVNKLLPGGCGEYLSIEFDTETKTFKVV